jgi:hypothetical protein
VNTDRAAAVRAGPSDLFIGNELPDSEPADGLQIFEHAHVVPGPISLVQLLHAGTGKLLTLKAKSRFDILKRFTVFDLASNAIDRFINVSSSAAGTFLFVPQIRHANAAVHSAGSNE